MFFNNPLSPGVGRGIAQSAEQAAKARRLVCFGREFQFDRIDLDRVIPGKVAFAVDELAERRPVPAFAQHETPGRD